MNNKLMETKMNQSDPDWRQHRDMRKRNYVPLARVAAALGCTLSTLYRWVRRGPVRPRGVRGVKIGKTTYIELDSLYTRVGPEAVKILNLRAKLDG
jgi:transposase-like protein